MSSFLEHLKKIDLSQARVEQNDIVFVCGGDASLDSQNNIESARKGFVGSSVANDKFNVVIAENFHDWHKYYSNLSEFEEDIASVSLVILMMLESPGTLVETGLFYANCSIREKMFFILEEKHHESESFIKLGILNSIKENHIFCFSGNISTFFSGGNEKENIEFILNEIEQIKQKKPSTFKPDNKGHFIFLVAQIINYFQVLDRGEILHILKSLNVKEYETRLDSALYILEITGCISRVKMGNFNFFKTESSRNYVSLKREGEKYITPENYKVMIFDSYVKSQDRKDKARVRVIKERCNGGA